MELFWRRKWPQAFRTWDHLGLGGASWSWGLCCSMAFWNHVVNSKTSYEKIMMIYCLLFCPELLFLWTLNIIQYYCRWTACLWYPIKASSGMNSYLLSSWIWLSRFFFFFFLNVLNWSILERILEIWIYFPIFLYGKWSWYWVLIVSCFFLRLFLIVVYFECVFCIGASILKGG